MTKLKENYNKLLEASRAAKKNNGNKPKAEPIQQTRAEPLRLAFFVPFISKKPLKENQ